jgi:hypothetical protein
MPVLIEGLTDAVSHSKHVLLFKCNIEPRFLKISQI